jgi:hypothetical protein
LESNDMNALLVLSKARAAGIEVTVAGESLVLRAAAKPPDNLMAALSQHKQEILRLLRDRPVEWDHADWQAYFAERAGIAQFDGGFNRLEAELCAFLDCVDRWLVMSPPVVDLPHLCLQCRLPLEGDHKVEAAGTAGKRGLLHAACADKWKVSRRTHARRQLSWLLDGSRGDGNGRNAGEEGNR